MLDPLDFRYHQLPESEMLRVFSEHKMEEKVSRCRAVPLPSGQSLMHRVFCCTIQTIEYFEPETDEYVATLVHQTYIGGKTPIRIIEKFQVGLDVYLQLLPPVPK